MPGCPRLALLCALPWLLRTAAPGSPAPPLARRDPHDPARGADFDRVYSGVVNLSTENIYSFSYTSQPGQVRSSPPSLDSQQLARPRRPSLLWVVWEVTSGDLRDWGPLAPFLIHSNHCQPSRASSATGLGNNSASFPASPGLAAGISGLSQAPIPARSAGPVRLPDLSLGKSQCLGSRRARAATLVLWISCREGNSFHWDDSARPFCLIAQWGGSTARNLKRECVRMDASCRTSVHS